MAYRFGRTQRGLRVHRWWVRCIVVIATAAYIAALPERAQAGFYTVTGCRTGWVPDVRNTTADLGPAISDKCDESGIWMLGASLASVYATNVGDYAGWRFDAPLDTTIAGATVRWRGRGDPGAPDHAESMAVLAASNSPAPVQRVDPFTRTDVISATDALWIRADIECVARFTAAACQKGLVDEGGLPSSAHIFIQQSTVTILDRFAPIVQTVGGSAVTDAAWTGSEPLTFAATDKGGGLFRVIVEADGVPVKALPAVADDRCVDRTGARDFGYPVPCPTQGAGSVKIDAADLPGGSHMVAVYLEDAAGNRAAIIPPTRKLIVNDYRAVGYYANGMFFNPRFASPRVANGAGPSAGRG